MDNNIPPQQTSTMAAKHGNQPKLDIDTMRLRQKKDALRQLDTVFSDRKQDISNNNDSEEEDHSVSNLGVRGMIAKLGKKSSMFQRGVTKVAESRANVPASPAVRKLPEPPAPSSTHRLSDASNQSMSDDNSSGSGSVITRRAGK
jgi:hypothetical protein